jgi:hypothetical protein
LPVITEIREFKIQPCKIDKELIGSIGAILESDPACQKEKKVYTLESSFRKIESDNSRDFTSTEWPNDATRMQIAIGTYYPLLVSIQIDFKSPGQGSVKVSSSDATWANGISKRIEEAFVRKKLGYSSFIEDAISRGAVSLGTWFSLSIAFTFSILKANSNQGIILDFAAVFSPLFIVGGPVGGIWIIYYFLGWLFPKYEFGETLQKRLRKWIWSLLVGSGLIAWIIDRLASSL